MLMLFAVAVNLLNCVMGKDYSSWPKLTKRADLSQKKPKEVVKLTVKVHPQIR